MLKCMFYVQVMYYVCLVSTAGSMNSAWFAQFVQNVLDTELAVFLQTDPTG